MNQDTTELYRHYNDKGVLLYVGISLSAAQRLSQHMRGSKWASNITAVTVERYENREEALRVERDVIKEEKPLWNIVHASENKPCRPQPTKKETPIHYGHDQVCETLIQATDTIQSLWNICSSVIGGGRGGQHRVNVEFHLRNPMSVSDIGIKELFYTSLNVSPGQCFRLVEYTSGDSIGIIDHGGFGILHPEYLEQRLAQEFNEAGLDAKCESVQIALNNYRAALDSCPWPLPR